MAGKTLLRFLRAMVAVLTARQLLLPSLRLPLHLLPLNVRVQTVSTRVTLVDVREVTHRRWLVVLWRHRRRLMVNWWHRWPPPLLRGWRREVRIKAVLVAVQVKLRRIALITGPIWEQRWPLSASTQAMTTPRRSLGSAACDVTRRFLRGWNLWNLINLVSSLWKAARDIDGILRQFDRVQKVRNAVFWCSICLVASHHRQLQHLVDGRPMTRIHLQQDANDL